MAFGYSSDNVFLVSTDNSLFLIQHAFGAICDDFGLLKKYSVKYICRDCPA